MTPNRPITQFALPLAALAIVAASAVAAAPADERGQRPRGGAERPAAKPQSERIAQAVATAAGALAGAALAADDEGDDGAPPRAARAARKGETKGDAKGERRRQCFRFSKQTVGSTWHPGDEIAATFGAVQLADFYIDGNLYTPPSGVEAQFMKVNQTRIAQGESPEMHGSLVNVRLLPKGPVRGVTMKFAQQLGIGGQLPASLEINGQRHDLRGSLAQADGLTLGDPKRGEARFRVVLVPDPSTPEQPSYWHRGTLEVRAVSGAIESLAFGAQLFNFDDLCIHR